MAKRQTKSGKKGRHATAEPRKLTAEGWWRQKAREQGKAIRPLSTSN